MSNIIEFDANVHNIDSVSIFFQSDQAEVRPGLCIGKGQLKKLISVQVTRKIVVQLAKGQNSLEVRNLPSVIDQNSIRVDGIGNATIFDVIYRSSVFEYLFVND